MNGAAGPLTDTLVDEIAAALDASVERAEFRVNGAAVHRLRVSPIGKTAVVLTLWPSLARADVLAGDFCAIFRGIDRVLLFPGQEAVFQRDRPRGFLLVSREGRIATAS